MSPAPRGSKESALLSASRSTGRRGMPVSRAAAAVPPPQFAAPRSEARSVGGSVCRPVSARLQAGLCTSRLGSERAAVRRRSARAGEGGGSSCCT